MPLPVPKHARGRQVWEKLRGREIILFCLSKYLTRVSLSALNTEVSVVKKIYIIFLEIYNII